jgi:hypothetical protein
MNIIVFSKDRGCQLDLFLRSMKMFAPELTCSNVTHVLYKYSNKQYGAGYDRTMFYHQDIHYVMEGADDFKKNVLELIDIDKELTVFFVDDIVFKDKFELECDEMKFFLNSEDAACLSLRMHPKINYNYTQNIPMIPPSFKKGEILSWNWREACPGDWSYPMSFDGHIFRTNDIYSKVAHLEYNNPNTFEGYLAINPVSQQNMICFNNSKLVNIPVNKVQTVNSNLHGAINQEYLNDQYLSGKKLSLEKLLSNDSFVNNISCHQIYCLEWE